MSEREESLLVRERERQKQWRSSLCFGIFYFGADSIFQEVAGFSPLWFPQGKVFVSLVSCVFIVVHVILSVKDPNIIMLA